MPSSLTRHIPAGQLRRYLVVGLWNTLFGYGSFALFTALLDGYIPASYMAAVLLSSVLSITVAFLGNKWFVFKTSGNYFKEWTRCLVVYSGGIAMGLLLLPPAVLFVGHFTGAPRNAPYVAGALIAGVQIVLSFFGNQRFSFRVGKSSSIGVDE